MKHILRLASVFLTLLALACTGGVGTGVQRAADADMAPPAPGPVEADSYRLHLGDRVNISFPHNPELNLSQAMVRPDGKIALSLAGDIAAYGLTVPELQAGIAKKYREFITRTGYSRVLKEGDYFDLRFVYNPELNIGARIGSDGKVSLPLLGEVKAAGYTPAAFRHELIKRYSRDLREPDIALLLGVNPNAFPMDIAAKKIFDQPEFITVTLVKSAGAQVFVGGEVAMPKAVPCEGHLTVLQAIAAAGGKKEGGDLSRVVILRRGPFEQTEWLQTDLASPLKGRDLTNDVALRGGDVVIVPLSGIARVGLWVKQWLRDAIPLYGSYNINLGGGTSFVSPIP